MRRFVTLALILVFSIPFGLSISGCKKSSFDFCNGSSGEQEGQIVNITLQPQLTGLSLAYGAITEVSNVNATDCKGDGVGVGRYTYGTTSTTYADISPLGAVCAGTWNRNTGSGVPDYSTCIPPAASADLPIPTSPAFSTPTAPTVTAGATSTLNYAVNPSGINGVVDISLAGGPVLTGVISNTTSASTFVAAFNAISAFSNNHIVATAPPPTVAGGNIVTITGPVGATETLSFTGTSLIGYVPAAYVTASAGGATSNAVPIYIHPAISSMQLTPQSACISQGVSAPLTASVTSIVNGSPTDITAMTGPLGFTPQNGTVVSINSTVVPPIATAELPGSTIISTSTSNASSPAGIFYTCPPKSITLSVPNSSSTSITLNQNTPQALNATVLDTNNNIITGLNLEYISTSLDTLSANSSGSLEANFPGAATVTAICQPSECNPSPLNQLGMQGNGLPVTSNPIQVTTPGTVNTVLYMASTSSQYFTSVDFSTGIPGSPTLLPYVPNSMIADKLGQTLYFGSPTELMEVSMANNTVSKVDASVKGTVVGVSNDGSVLVMSDAVHGLIYIYYPATGANTSFGGIATRAVFAPDNQHIYIAGQFPAPTPANPNPTVTQNFFVYSNFDGWHPSLVPATPTDMAVSEPSIAAFLAGTTTTERSYCATGAPPASQSADAFYPQVSTPQAVQTDRLAATFDSKHLLGATATGNTLSDFPLTLSAGGTNPGACPTFFNLSAPNPPLALGVTASSITGVLPDSASQVAFVTYATSSPSSPALLPAYLIPSSGVGTITDVTLSGSATAPVSGVFSTDRQTFYAGTAGDNLVHIISVPNVLNSVTPADTGTKTPALPLCITQDAFGNCTASSTSFATPNLLADKPRPTT
ncbi:MAG TPA: hypothetical protein VNU94_09760 [Acidobacteriaceae bacterium]|jgi:hypothetical protein|nr:hypothetical protein [Acidobacteriaceae bacterium]